MHAISATDLVDSHIFNKRFEQIFSYIEKNSYQKLLEQTTRKKSSGKDTSEKPPEPSIYITLCRNISIALYRNISIRWYVLHNTAISISTSIYHELIGIILSVGMLCTLGIKKSLNDRAIKELQIGSHLISDLFLATILFLFPTSYKTFSGFKECNEESYVTHFVLFESMNGKEYNLSKSHSASLNRFEYLTNGVSCLIARVIDFVHGIFLSFISLFSRGRNISYESKDSRRPKKSTVIVAYQQLQIFHAVTDFFCFTTKILNPKAKLYAYRRNYFIIT